MKSTLHWKTVQRWKTSGQALILIVATFFGLLLFLGLMVDLGQIFLAKGYLRRAADAASLAAAAQWREAQSLDKMKTAAEEVAQLNGVALASIKVQTCETNPGDSALCPQGTDLPKKMVRVIVTMDYPLTFLSLLGVNKVTLTETSISEAASMDVVLVIDVSESMAWLGSTSTQQDPSVCNYDTVNPCQPFQKVKTAAKNFADKILINSDPTTNSNRLAIVTFANGWQLGSQGTQVVGMSADGWTTSKTIADSTIDSLQVYDPGSLRTWDEGDLPDPLPLGVVREYYMGVFQGYECLMADFPEAAKKPEAYSACGTTNIGGGLLLAGNQFAVDKRPEALWVVVMLTDGMANATFPTEEDFGGTGNDIVIPSPSNPGDEATLKQHLPLGFCPDWIGEDTDPNRVYCQDDNANPAKYHPLGSAMYDAEDFAMDQARFVACPAVNPPIGCSDGTENIKGQGAIIFTIGMGDEIWKVLDKEAVPKPYGGALLRWIAALGDDGNPDDTDLCSGVTDYQQNCGNYFYSPANDAALLKVFEAIYSRIYTRLTQ